MDIKVFESFPVTAGFTRRPDLSDERRAGMIERMTAVGGHVIRPHMVHGTKIQLIDDSFLKGKPVYTELDGVDGMITKNENVLLNTTHGDCIPIFAYCPSREAIGLAHAGWRGTLAGIAEVLIREMEDKLDCSASEIFAYIGPGIGCCHFEVGNEVAERFRNELPWGTEYITYRKKAYIDLKGVNERFLRNTGVRNIAVSPECTVCDEKQYYSYRRDKDMRRMLAYIVKGTL